MKSYSIEWNLIEHAKPALKFSSGHRLNRLHQVAARSFVALVPALAIVIAAVWLAASAGLALYLQAALWASGFVFLGLALDLEKRAALAAVATGIALPSLAYLSSRFAIEFALMAAVLVAAWVAVAIFRR